MINCKEVSKSFGEHKVLDKVSFDVPEGVIVGLLGPSGAGKTTLIQKMLREAYTGEKIALIENEFGQVAVDGALLRNRQVAVSEINAGCICCTLSEDFTSSLSDLLDRLQPDRILIEPSGVGKLSDILAAVRSVTDSRNDVYLGSVMTVVDPFRAEANIGAFG